MIRKHVLPNGIRLVCERIAYVQSVAIGIWVGCGSRYEEERVSGISHFIEHMAFKGTGCRTASQLAEAMDAIGGDLNAFTDKEHTCFYARVLSEHLPIAVDILSDMLLHSAFPEEELEREKHVVLDEIHRHEDSPDDLVHDLLAGALWKEHPLGRPVIGTPEAVGALTRQDLLDYVARHYTAGRTVISVAGHFDPQQLLPMIAEAFGGMDHTQREPPPPDLPAHTTPSIISRDTEQVHFCLGTKGFPQQDKRRYPLAVMDTILGGGMSSRLFQEIREKRGLAYNIGSYTNSYRDAGMFVIYGGTGPEYVEQVMDLIQAEIQKIRTTPVPDEELERARNQIKSSLIMAQESMFSRMSFAGKSELTYGRVIPLKEIIRMVEKVTPADICAVAETIFNSHPLVLAAIGPMEEQNG